MPGAFAHLTMVDILAGDEDHLDTITTLTPSMKHALGFFTNFCELGAVSPDYPYLTPLHPSAKAWADVMHYYETAEFVRRGIRHLTRQFPNVEVPEAEQCIAWLFGYTAHVVADLTAHPVIKNKVGPYEQHKTEHRVCELHQDVYIVKMRYREEIGTPEHSTETGIASCSDDNHALQPSVATLWRNILSDIDLSTIVLKNGLNPPISPPNPYQWYHWYVEIIDTIEHGRRLPPLSRHFAEDQGIVYPPFDDLNREYIDHLNRPPYGAATTYDHVFDEALNNISGAWAQLGAAITAQDPQQFRLPNADLDTGAYEQFVFWSA
jgi:hypothetical protein